MPLQLTPLLARWGNWLISGASAEHWGLRIDEALWAGRPRLFPDRGTVVASLLWRLAPSLYLAQVRRRFADDLG